MYTVMNQASAIVIFAIILLTASTGLSIVLYYRCMLHACTVHCIKILLFFAIVHCLISI